MVKGQPQSTYGHSHLFKSVKRQRISPWNFYTMNYLIKRVKGWLNMFHFQSKKHLFRFTKTKFKERLGSLFQNDFLTKQRWNWETWERFFSIIGSRRKKSFSFYTGIMVCEKCKKYRCHGRISAPRFTILTSVGTVNFWTTKWIPNEKNKAYLEIILPYLSKDTSWAKFRQHEGIQK